MSLINNPNPDKTSGKRPTILILGDPAGQARYHPIESLQASLGILETEAELIVSTDYRQLASREVPFANVDLIINYIDNWSDLDAWQQSRIAARLLIWLAGGGALLTVHNGIITRESTELLQMHGAAFTRHDDRTVLGFELAEDADELLAANFESYEELDEPYEYRFDTFFEEGFKVWLNYRYKDSLFPAGWHRQFGEGRMLYLMPGHDETACKNPNFGILLRNSCRFLLHHLDGQMP